MTERQYEELGERMLAAYDAAEQEMLRRTANRLARGVNTPGWTEQKYAEMRAARQSIETTLAKVHKEGQSILGDAVTAAYGDSQQRFILQNRDAVEAMGLLNIHGNAVNVANILSDLDSRINAAERLVLRRYDDVYANVIGETSSLVATGAYTQRQALNVAMQKFADRGVTGFVDKAGRHWSLPTYTETALLTAIERASVLGYVDTMESYGYDLAVLSSHAGACPVCAAWEGVILSVSGSNDAYPSLDEAEAAGVFHPRCLHDLYTYYPGISHGDLRNSPREIEPAEPEYTARSEQRYMESTIRRYKRRMAAAVTPEAERQAYNHVRAWQKRLREHLEDHADMVLPRKYWREGGRTKFRLNKL